jgi:hypothetical protein
MPATDASQARPRTHGPEPSPPPSAPPTESPAPGGRAGPSAGPHPAREWPERVTELARYTGQWVARPRVRLSLIGVLLLLLGGIVVTNSVWTLPVVVVGALMVIVAWIGHRLEGRFAVEWGETGTELAFRATIKPAAGEGHPALASEAARAPEAASGGEVIEGEAHTVEIDVAELRALIAAAEQAQPAAPISPATDIGIRRAVDGVRSSQPVR